MSTQGNAVATLCKTKNSRSADAILLFFYAHLPRVGRAEGLQKRPRFCVFGENLMKLRKRIVLRRVRLENDKIVDIKYGKHDKIPRIW